MATRDYTIVGPGGRELTITGPDNATPEQLRAAAERAFSGSPAGKGPAPAAVPQEPSEPSMVERFAESPVPRFMRDVVTGKVAQGALSGAADIGNTLLRIPGLRQAGQAAYEALGGAGDRAESLADYNREADTGAGFTLGRLGGNIAGTAGVGSALAIPVRAAGVAPRLATALETSGFSTGGAPVAGLRARLGDNALRVLGGATTGGAAAGLIDPESAGIGAGIGAALPPAVRGAWALGAGAARLLEGPTRSAARSLAQSLGVDENALAGIIARLRGAETFVPGSQPTVSQATMLPAASALEDIVHDATLTNALRATRQAQGQARLNALEAISPTSATGVSEARNDLGTAIARRVIPEERAISRSVSQQYRGVDPNASEAITLPVDDMQAAVDRYMGRGSFSASADPATAVAAARGLSAPQVPEAASVIVDATGAPMRAAGEAVPRAATWDEVGKLRSSLNKALRMARKEGDRQAIGALEAQKSAIDEAINRDLTPEARAAWLEANASHAAKQGRFHTGPQASIFRVGPTGEPAVQGGEVAAKFWGARPGLADDVMAFRRLIDDNPDMLGRFRSMVTTEGAGTAKASGELTSKFSKWVTERLPGLRNAFDPQDVEALQRIAADIDRAEAAAAAGGPRGSKTFQNASNAMRLGLLESPAMTWIANRIPLGGPALESLRGSARSARANRLAELLANPDEAANALERLTQGGISVDPALAQIPYRVAPALSVQR